ncbi:protein mono-ADP-ribosyltransferase PARP14-like, partial [Mercenaria mercenaria]|uniref:protein mono-ADP-ribosyltransferase PARP14-like n=1 Tax=Mercenaria mercenaria TaxID=6596 RepID=UPI00234F2A30
MSGLPCFGSAHVQKTPSSPADVIVNTTAPDLQLRNGVVSKSIHDSAGKEIQDECFKKYHRNLDNGEIVITKGYKLKCKHVFHGALQAYDRRKDEHSLQHIEKFITDCLWKANFLGHKSIAFPVIGTGRLEYPAHRIADALFKGVKSFEKECTSAMTIQLVKVVIFKDSEVVKVFESKKIKYEKEDDKIVKQEVDHLTSRKMQCSGVTINAEMASSAAACGMAEALVVFFDNTSVPTLKTSQLLKYMGNSAASEFSANRNVKKPFATKPGNLSNNTVIHVPVKNTQNSLKEGFQRGLRLADSKMIYSAAVYFDAKE